MCLQSLSSANLRCGCILGYSRAGKKDGLFRLAPVVKTGGSAQIHLPLSGDDARGRPTRRIQSGHVKAARSSPASRLDPRS